MTLNPFKTITITEAVEGVIDMAQGFGMYTKWLYNVNHSEFVTQRYYLNQYYAKNDENDYVLAIIFKIKDGNKIPFKIFFVRDISWNAIGHPCLWNSYIVISGNILSKHWKLKWDFKMWCMNNAIRKFYETQALMDKTEKIAAIRLASKNFEN